LSEHANKFAEESNKEVNRRRFLPGFMFLFGYYFYLLLFFTCSQASLYQTFLRQMLTPV